MFGHLFILIFYNSLTLEVKVRFDWKSERVAGYGTRSTGLNVVVCHRIVRENGQISIMPLFCEIISQRSKRKINGVQKQKNYPELRTLAVNYPTQNDRDRLWHEFESYTMVSSLSNIP